MRSSIRRGFAEQHGEIDEPDKYIRRYRPQSYESLSTMKTTQYLMVSTGAVGLAVGVAALTVRLWSTLALKLPF